jgi:hypothetical protein
VRVLENKLTLMEVGMLEDGKKVKEVVKEHQLHF